MMVFISAAATERQMVAAASKSLPDGFPAVRALDSSKLQSDDEIGILLADVGEGPCVFVVRVLGGKSYFERGFARLRDFCRGRNRYLIALPGDQNPDAELDAVSNIPLAVAAKAFQYALASGVENYRNLLRYLSDIFLSTRFGFDGPASMPDAGLYHPDAGDRAACANLGLAEFQHCYWREHRPAIGILFYRAYWQSGDLAVVDELAREIETRGYNILPVFCYSLREESVKASSANIFSKYFVNDAGPTVDCVISLFSYAVAELLHEERTTTAGGRMADYLETLAIPFVQAITTSLTVSDWQESAAGLPPWDAATKVVMPEFDGRIIGPVVGFRKQCENGKAASDTESYTIGLADRTRACADLATRYSVLRRKPNAEKRLALVLTNFANRHGRIGSAVGLDTPSSVVRLMRGLRERGYDVTNIPESGDALMEELIALGGYDREYLTEEQMRLSTARYGSAEYERWFSEFPAVTQVALEQEWGARPGSVFRRGEEIYVAGKLYGNIFVMIQPPRGFGENPLAVYHSGDLIPTHHYLGAYHDLARIYLEWGGFAYTRDIYGAPAHDEFQYRLAGTEIAAQNKDNYEHDIFDSDDYMQFHGGMIAAIRSLTRSDPMAVLGDSANPETARNRDVREEARRVFRARVADPKWLRAIRRHGYKGALEMAATVDYLFGYDATAQVIDDWMYQQVAEKYVLDETSREFCERSNPWALREMTARLLEAAERGMWGEPDTETLARLKSVFLANEGLLEAKGERQ